VIERIPKSDPAHNPMARLKLHFSLELMFANGKDTLQPHFTTRSEIKPLWNPHPIVGDLEFYDTVTCPKPNLSHLRQPLDGQSR
jgi:hypothetical protein